MVLEMIQSRTEPAEKTDWTAFRSEMPVARQWAYFDHAAVAPLSGPAGQAIAAWNEDAIGEWRRVLLRLDAAA